MASPRRTPTVVQGDDQDVAFTGAIESPPSVKIKGAYNINQFRLFLAEATAGLSAEPRVAPRLDVSARKKFGK